MVPSHVNAQGPAEHKPSSNSPTTTMNISILGVSRSGMTRRFSLTSCGLFELSHQNLSPNDIFTTLQPTTWLLNPHCLVYCASEIPKIP